jgi:hypothetical protein
MLGGSVTIGLLGALAPESERVPFAFESLAALAAAAFVVVRVLSPPPDHRHEQA